MAEESATIKGVLKQKHGFDGNWKTCFCELRDKVMTIHEDLEDSPVERELNITPSVVIHIIRDTLPTRFTIEMDDEPIYMFSTDTTAETMNWVHHLRSLTYTTDKLSMDDFNIICVIGKGRYGKVMLCEKKETGEKFAVKAVKKSALQKSQNFMAIMSERNNLMRTNFPFIVKIKFAFQTPTKFYIGMEYIPGGELYHILYNNDIKISDCKLYLAEIALSLQYLHTRGIIYRDLKLENIMVGADGHIKLVDFGLSKDLSVSNETSTFCGTIHYVAPELILQKPYSYQIDWWAFGIITAEILFGECPFYDTNPTKEMERIVKSPPVFPDEEDSVAKDFISRFLVKRPSKRAKIEDVMNHPFWEGIDFQKVLEKMYKPQFIPKLNDINENFDKEFTNCPAVDSFSSPVNESKIDISGFSFSEDENVEEEICPSSILTLELIDPN